MARVRIDLLDAVLNWIDSMYFAGTCYSDMVILERADTILNYIVSCSTQLAIKNGFKSNR